MIEGKRVFITGGAGFIGSTIAARLVDRNQVVIYDNFYRDSISSKSFRNHPHLEVVKGDVLDYSALSKAMSGADIVVHCAAIAGIDTVIQHPVSTMRVNMIGSANVLDAASRLPNCQRVLCFSTSEVFGQFAFRSVETDNAVVGELGQARWVYAVSKVAVEHLAMGYFTEKSLPITVLRPFNVYGPGQIGEGALKTFVSSALQNKPIEIHGDGTQIRAWCYVDDLADCVMLTIDHPKAIGESFNVGNQRAIVTIYGLANIVVRVLNSQSTITFSKKDYVDVEIRVPSVRKAQQLLGFQAKVELEDGIRRTAEYYRNKLP